MTVTGDNSLRNDSSDLFHIAYASRASEMLCRDGLIELARHSARQNPRISVSGVLMHGGEKFLQWIEGPRSKVGALMSSISEDPRHTNITVLDEGAIPQRRFANWPMRFYSDTIRLEDWAGGREKRKSEVDRKRATVLFRNRAAEHRMLGRRSGSKAGFDAGLFAERLAKLNREDFTFPEFATHSVMARATVVNETFGHLARGWRDDRWSSIQIVLALARLNFLWQKSRPILGGTDDRQTVCIVVPPGSQEILGAIVKTDLLSGSGFGTRLIAERDFRATIASIDKDEHSEIIVSGPRVGLYGDAERASSLADRLRIKFPQSNVHLGGSQSGPLTQWPERLAPGSVRQTFSRRTAISNLALEALRAIARKK
ncbi:MAG: BLUF domain-containing protein [Pseudomonadota bacterium]